MEAFPFSSCVEKPLSVSFTNWQCAQSNYRLPTAEERPTRLMPTRPTRYAYFQFFRVWFRNYKLHKEKIIIPDDAHCQEPNKPYFSKTLRVAILFISFAQIFPHAFSIFKLFYFMYFIFPRIFPPYFRHFPLLLFPLRLRFSIGSLAGII